MKPLAFLLVIGTYLALVDSYEVKSKYLAYSPEEEARYQSNLVFLKNFIKEQRYDKKNINSLRSKKMAKMTLTFLK